MSHFWGPLQSLPRHFTLKDHFGTGRTARTVRLLVIEHRLEDIFLPQEALSEMAEAHSREDGSSPGSNWRTWMEGIRPVFTASLALREGVQDYL